MWISDIFEQKTGSVLDVIYSDISIQVNVMRKLVLVHPRTEGRQKEQEKKRKKLVNIIVSLRMTKPDHRKLRKFKKRI